jgi:hypothetical protein
LEKDNGLNLGSRPVDKRASTEDCAAAMTLSSGGDRGAVGRWPRRCGGSERRPAEAFAWSSGDSEVWRSPVLRSQDER